MHALYRKAMWIAEQLNEDVEDVYDVLLFNIKKPESLVTSVFDLLLEYNTEVEKNS
jgi:hypothetical protein